MSLSADRLWLMFQLAQAAMNTGKVGSYLATTCLDRLHGRSRRRDIFPLPQLIACEVKPENLTTRRWLALRHFVNAVIGCLNWCANVKSGASGPLKLTAVQHDVVRRIIDRSLDMELRLQDAQPGSWELHVPDWVPILERPGGPELGGLSAERVDVLPMAGQCDPVPCLPRAVQDMVCNDECLFGNAPPSLAHYENVLPKDRAEYVKLVVRQLRARQLGLTAQARGGGTVFAVGKPGGTRQRAVWHGRRVSAAAKPPPKPRHLASPSAPALLESRPGHKIRCSCWFDQLRLRCKSQRWMGRPPVTLDELQQFGGMNFEEVRAHLLPGEEFNQNFFVPVSLTWPMGFAWSSFVGQEFLARHMPSFAT